jgi:low molecular weight phosphotyrosine protein phosphatase
MNVSPKSPSAKISMFSAYSPSHSGSPAGKQPDIVDPYYGQGTSGFERCYKQCVEYSDGLLDELEKETGRGVKAGL